MCYFCFYSFVVVFGMRTRRARDYGSLRRGHVEKETVSVVFTFLEVHVFTFLLEHWIRSVAGGMGFSLLFTVLYRSFVHLPNLIVFFLQRRQAWLPFLYLAFISWALLYNVAFEIISIWIKFISFELLVWKTITAVPVGI